MLPSQWASSGHKRTKLHWIHRGTAFQTSAKGADVDHDVYFARESLQDGLRRAVQTEQTVNHNEAVCVQSVDVCWTSLSPLTFFCFVFFFPSPFWLFLSHPFASLGHLSQFWPFFPCPNCIKLPNCALWTRSTVASGDIWRTANIAGTVVQFVLQRGLHGKPQAGNHGRTGKANAVRHMKQTAVMAVMAVSWTLRNSPKLATYFGKPVDSSENRIDRC